MSRSSSTDSRASEPRVPSAPAAARARSPRNVHRPPMSRRTGRHLAATLTVAGLALAGTNLDLPTTNAVFSASASASVEGFRVQPLCDFDSYTSVPDLLAALEPTLHWGFDAEASGEGWTAAGDPPPVAVEPDGTLMCDDGVLALAPGASVTSAAPLGAGTVVIVPGTPSSSGVLLSLLADDGGLEVLLDGTAVLVRAWSDAEPEPVDVVTGELDAGGAHVLALTVTGGETTLWVDGTAQAAPLPVTLTGLGATFGLGTLAELDPPHETAEVTVSELAVVGAVTTAELEALHAAAVPAA